MEEELELTVETEEAHEEVPTIEQPEAKPKQQSLGSAVLIGAAAGIVGTSLGLALITYGGKYTDQPVEPTIESASPIVQEQRKETAPPHHGWYLQVAAYRNLNGAQESAERLIAAGFDVEIAEKDQLHRLLVGPVDSPEALAQTKDRLVAAMGPDLDRTIPGPWLPIESTNN